MIPEIQWPLFLFHPRLVTNQVTSMKRKEQSDLEEFYPSPFPNEKFFKLYFSLSNCKYCSNCLWTLFNYLVVVVVVVVFSLLLRLYKKRSKLLRFQHFQSVLFQRFCHFHFRAMKRSHRRQIIDQFFTFFTRIIELI